MTKSSKLNIGGQAVIEGVMMKSPNYVSVAVRKPNKKVIIEPMKYDSITKKFKFLALPLFRGVVMLLEMMVLGIKALTFSANESLDEEDESKNKEKDNKETVKTKSNKANIKANKEPKEKEELSKIAIAFTIFLSLLFAVGLFVVLPYALTVLIGIQEEKSSILFNLIDGIIKLSIFIAYIYLIGLMKDIKRVFQYHGAEHKAVNCYEAGKKLTIKNCQSYSTVNPRCGTSFLLFVIFLGIIVFSIVPWLVITIWPSIMNLTVVWRKVIMLSVRILFLFPLAAVSYEFLKFTAKHCSSWLVKVIMQPGLWVQKLTTREPEDDMVKVAIKAIEDVLGKENKLKIKNKETTLT
ncbi:DUF1385 domain-containing protein [Candidatus Woesearchaeota archaeon]|jgi:uncharacterized protein YqhQ|nr:DUF1385 domain-containing protein [Candidatus Woesearchaeota archaeon]